MARIPYPDPDNLTPEDRDLLSSLPQLNIFRLLATSPALFQPLIKLFNAYLSNGLLSDEHREIIILRVGHLCRSKYELFQHERVAREIGMDEAKIQAIGGQATKSHFAPQEQALIEFVDQVVQSDGASEKRLTQLRAFMSDAQVLEATIIVGVYIMVCKTASTFDIELESKPIEGSGIETIQAGLDRMNRTEG